ncbi:uncharacterized protein LOC144139971 [Haemaphysalis longicornis]
MAPRDSNAHPPLQQRAKLPKPEASKVKGAVTRNAEPTTLPLSPEKFFDVASVWPGEPRLAETSTCLESQRPDENASKQLRATHQRIHNPRGKLTDQINYYDSILKEHSVIKRAWLFRDPADPELLGLRDYHEIIKHPMDMKMVKENKDNREYDSAEEFARDMRLIFTICDRCNPPEHEVVAMVQELQTLSCGTPSCPDYRLDGSNATRDQMLQPPATPSRANRIAGPTASAGESSGDATDVSVPGDVLRYRGKEQQLLFKDLERASCKALSSVFVFTEGTWENVESWPVLQQLSLCSHITSVRLSATWRNSEPLFTAIAHYVEATVTLKELYLQMLCDADSREEDVSCWTIFSDSLSRNKSIRNVGIHRLGLYDEVSELLADAVKSRKDTWRVEFHNGAKPPGAFIRRLSEGITDNFTLLNVTLHGTVPTEFVGDWLVVDEVVRRNSGLLTRAAQFVTGVLRDRYGAQALERVHDNPALQEEIMQVASVDSDEAASMIRRALRSIEDLHAFMVLSGVVRERVVCLPRHDGRTQLDDLNEHCWARVRQYLLVEHVRYSGWPSL